ncbi:alpha-N-acetylgalactosaminide alpha-2,6-sialyltransferase 3-like [Diadema setosum]|uniref:alpha-N-acetylgalactosaminide alpha-2,6-sialyltransferase 3-like n=1 Tax=Diadema setosum TaxID=31175 RepID=UPI003B3A1B41
MSILLCYVLFQRTSGNQAGIDSIAHNIIAKQYLSDDTAINVPTVASVNRIVGKSNSSLLRQKTPPPAPVLRPSSPPINTSIAPGYFLLDSSEPFLGRCHKCALVSSSGHLRNSGAGADIERADCVLRMNTATVKGYEEDVGTRTDIRIIGHVNLPRGLVKSGSLRAEILSQEKTRAKYIVVPWLYEENVNMKTNKIVRLARSFKRRYRHPKFVFLTKEKHKESENRYLMETGFKRASLNTWFSTGFVSMMFALDVCDEVEVFGLSNSDYCKLHPKSRVLYHYYGPSTQRQCTMLNQHENMKKSGHRFITERVMFARWSLVYNLTFHYPSWRATIQNTTALVNTEFLSNYKSALKNKSADHSPRTVIKNGRKFLIMHKRIIKKRVKHVAPKNRTTNLKPDDGAKSSRAEDKHSPDGREKVLENNVKRIETKKIVNAAEPKTASRNVIYHHSTSKTQQQA